MKGSLAPAKWGEWFRRYQAVLLVLAVGLALLLWPQRDEAETAQASETREAGQTVQVEELEARLADALAQIQGVGDCTVVLTLASGERQVLATDQKGENQETVVVSAGSGQEQPVTVQQIGPEYQGALVVCSGGGNAQVKLQVLQAVEALTGLSANQISICEGTGGSKP